MYCLLEVNIILTQAQQNELFEIHCSDKKVELYLNIKATDQRT